jgi:beta-1,4-glucuronyltransferase 1
MGYRWQAPLSIALHAPGSDYDKTVESIQYLRNCDEQKDLIKQFATFHIYFHAEHMPKQILTPDVVLKKPYDCPTSLPHMNLTDAERYTKNNNLTYPVNVGRNAARDAALTHFILASDIELYPSPNLPEKFLKMIAQMSNVSLHKPR